MRRMPWATYLWPGLPQLWDSGFWSGLVLAAGFALLLNLLLLASFVWVELLSSLHLRVGWLAAGSLWMGAAVISGRYGARGRYSNSSRDGGRGPGHSTASAEVLFREALSEYLQGSWFEAEAILKRLLHLDPRDMEARLLLATLLRHTRRRNEALEQLDRLERLRDAPLWAQEIAAERLRIAGSYSDEEQVGGLAADQPAEEQAPANKSDSSSVSQQAA